MRFRVITFDLPGPSATGDCDAGFVTYGTYNYKGQRIIMKTVCGFLEPGQVLITDTNWAWLVFIGTGFTQRGKQHRGLNLEACMLQSSA